MTGPTILTTAALPPRRCWLCGSPAVAGTGVAVARWWCLRHIEVGLANTTVDLALARDRARWEDAWNARQETTRLVVAYAAQHMLRAEPFTVQDALDVSAALQEESLPWRPEGRGDDDQEAATA